jgi:hypothetical protein
VRRDVRIDMVCSLARLRGFVVGKRDFAIFCPA